MGSLTGLVHPIADQQRSDATELSPCGSFAVPHGTNINTLLGVLLPVRAGILQNALMKYSCEIAVPT